MKQWEPILKGTPLEGKMPEGLKFPEGILPLSFKVANDWIENETNERPIPVTFEGYIVGICHAGRTEFFDCPEAKRAISYINSMNGRIGISSRKTGTINPDGTITEGPEKEWSIIKEQHNERDEDINEETDSSGS